MTLHKSHISLSKMHVMMITTREIYLQFHKSIIWFDVNWTPAIQPMR